MLAVPSKGDRVSEQIVMLRLARYGLGILCLAVGCYLARRYNGSHIDPIAVALIFSGLACFLVG